MARLVKLTDAKQWHDPDKDKEVYVNPDFVQTLREDKALKIVEIVMREILYMQEESWKKLPTSFQPITNEFINNNYKQLWKRVK